MDSSSQPQPPKSKSKSTRRRRKHSRNRKSRANQTSCSTTTMAISEPSSPSSPFSWRLERRTSSSPSKEQQRSHGIAPSRFHAKLEDAVVNTDKENKGESEPKQEQPAWKVQTERNVLIQQQKEHTGKLEARRKEFRKTTQLKTWPLQDLA